MRPFHYILIALLIALAGCSGYSFGEGGTSVLPPEYRTLAVEEVKNPTTLSWIEPRIRTLLRDELHNRNVITWVDDKNQADALITIDIESYNRPTSVSSGTDKTLLSEANFHFTAVIRSATDNSVVWRSGDISQTWPFYSGGEAEADEEVTRLGIRRLADRMTQNY